MGMMSRKLRNIEGGRLGYWCQGCEQMHQVAVGEGPGPRWGWNGDVEKPTFTPSVLVWWTEPANIGNPEALRRDVSEAQARRDAGEQNVKVPQVDKRCHTFITDGRVQFLGDCTHQYAGQTLDLPDLPGAWRDD